MRPTVPWQDVPIGRRSWLGLLGWVVLLGEDHRLGGTTRRVAGFGAAAKACGAATACDVDALFFPVFARLRAGQARVLSHRPRISRRSRRKMRDVAPRTAWRGIPSSVATALAGLPANTTF